MCLPLWLYLLPPFFLIPDPYFDHVLKPIREGTRALQSSCPCMGSVRVQPDLEIGCVGQRTQTFFTG